MNDWFDLPAWVELPGYTLLNFSPSKLQRFSSFSITNKFLGFFIIKFLVKFPVPGPISTILSILFK